jgi:hypothetical protein
MLLAKDDGAVFELPAELQADRLEIELHGAQMAGQSTGGLAQLQLRWRRDGTDQARDVSIGPGAEQIVIPLPESKLSAAVSLLRTSSEGPPVAIGHRGVRVRGSAPRSLWLNTAFAFLSLWPPWLAAAAVLWALLPWVAAATAAVLALALFGITLALPGFHDGIRIGALAGGEWIGWLGWAGGHTASWWVALVALALALAGSRRPAAAR